MQSVICHVTKGRDCHPADPSPAGADHPSLRTVVFPHPANAPLDPFQDRHSTCQGRSCFRAIRAALPRITNLAYAPSADTMAVRISNAAAILGSWLKKQTKI